MDRRFWLGLAGFVVFIGGGCFYLFHAHWKRQREIRRIMRLPKRERKLWYRLRNHGYHILEYRPSAQIRILTLDEPLSISIQVEWLVTKQKKTWAVIRKPSVWEQRQCLQSFFPTVFLYETAGVLWYEEETGAIYPWELEKT